ncbi:uncharacterized protein [Montipora capricornis]|uniref:uncharacterized protein n=1 Tax=Montipora capricornis TaxID=246305 RepID=UPI0035F19A16
MPQAFHKDALSFNLTDAVSAKMGTPEREKFFKDKKSKKKTLWEEISKEMQEKGYGYTGAQCETKFKNLKQNFTKTVDHNNVSGNDKKTCPYFEELNDIFGMTPSVKPVAVCSNRAGPVGEDLIRTSSSSGSVAEAAASSTDGRRPSLDNEETPRREVKRSRAKRALQSKESLTDLFKEYQREQRKKTRKRRNMSWKCTSKRCNDLTGCWSYLKRTFRNKAC